MNIEVFSKDQGINGGRELWFKVQSNEMLDWAGVEAKLDERDAGALKELGPKTLFYYPHLMTAQEKADSGFTFEDWWVWQQDKTSGTWATETETP